MKSSMFGGILALVAIGVLFASGCTPRTVAPTALVQNVHITKVLKATPVASRDIVNAVLVFDKTVPNEQSLMIVDLTPGRKLRLTLWPVSQDVQGKPIQLGQPTFCLDVQWSPANDKLTASDLEGCAAQRVPSH